LDIFTRRQIIYNINGTKIGGQPGELPTVLIGTIFYPKMKYVYNMKKGCFDRNKVVDYIRRAEAAENLTGNPHFLAVQASSSEAMEKYLEFITEVTDMPFLIDAPSADIRVSAAKYVAEVGLQERTIWNSISLDTSEKEFQAIKNAELKSAVLLAFNPADFSPPGRIKVLIKLLDIAEKLNIKNVLVDVSVLDIPSIGYSAHAIRCVKNIYGLPSGCAPANATYQWRDKRQDLLYKNFLSCDSAVNGILSAYGADFLFYGPIGAAMRVSKAVGVIDAIIASYMLKHGVKPLTKNHPFYKIL